MFLVPPLVVGNFLSAGGRGRVEYADDRRVGQGSPPPSYSSGGQASGISSQRRGSRVSKFRTTRDDALLVKCPRCEAPAGENCNGTRGKRRSVQVERMRRAWKTGFQTEGLNIEDGIELRKVVRQDRQGDWFVRLFARMFKPSPFLYAFEYLPTSEQSGRAKLLEPR